MKKAGHSVTTYTDIRHLLDDKNVDAVAVAMPNHWHALAAVWACQAGKDVYVEKPLAYNIWERTLNRRGGQEVRSHRAGRHAEPLQHRAARGGRVPPQRADRQAPLCPRRPRPSAVGHRQGRPAHARSPEREL